MSGFPGPAVARLTGRQALWWGLAFAVIGALVIAFFIYGRLVRPVLG